MDYHETNDAIAALVSRLPAPSAWDELEAFAREPVPQPDVRTSLMWRAISDWLSTQQMEGELHRRCEQLLDLLPYEVRNHNENYLPEWLPSWPYIRHLDYQNGHKRKITRGRRDLIETSTHLRSLGYKASDLLKEEDFIWGLKHLERLAITNSKQTRTLELTKTYEHITQLAIPYTGLRSYEVLRSFPNLTSLTITDSKHLTDLSEIARLTSLERLTLHRCEEFESLEPLRTLEHLSHLDLYECQGVNDHETLGYLPALERVDLTCVWRLAVKPRNNVLLRREDVVEYQESIGV